jgi:hypothetical protein
MKRDKVQKYMHTAEGEEMSETKHKEHNRDEKNRHKAGELIDRELWPIYWCIDYPQRKEVPPYISNASGNNNHNFKIYIKKTVTVHKPRESLY